jgi:hypothetical protein
MMDAYIEVVLQAGRSANELSHLTLPVEQIAIGQFLSSELQIAHLLSAIFT